MIEPKPSTLFEVSYKSLFKVAVAVIAFTLFARLIPLFLFLTIAVFIGIAMSTVVNRLKTYHIPTWVSQMLIALSVAAFVYFLLDVLVPSVVFQVSTFAEHLPEYRKTIEAMFTSPGLRKFIHTNLDHAPDAVGSVPEKAALFGGMTVNFLYQFAVLIILSIYFMIDGTRAYQSISKMVGKYTSPETKLKLDQTAAEIKGVVLAYALGQCITCLFVAIYTYAVAKFLHLPGAITLAAIATLCDLIPVIGFMCSLAVSCLVAFTVSPATALILGALYLGYTLVENYLIIPKVYGQTMKLSRLVVLLSILIGGKLYGITGMFLILPIAGSWHAIEKYWVEPKFGRGEIS